MLGSTSTRRLICSSIVLAKLALVSACSSGRASPEAEPAVEAPTPISASAVVAVETAEVPTWIVTTGSLVAHDRSDVVPNVPGKVLEVLVERGAHVEAGDPLVRLDVRDARLSAREAKANLAGLEAAQDLAETTCARSATLASRGAVSSSEAERDAANCRQAEENVRAAKVRAQAASKSIADGMIRAPFAGIVGERKVSVGEWANLGAPIVSLVEDGPLRAELELSEAAAVHVALGTEVEIRAIALPDQVFRAKVTRVAPELDPSSRARLTSPAPSMPPPVTSPTQRSTTGSR